MKKLLFLLLLLLIPFSLAQITLSNISVQAPSFCYNQSYLVNVSIFNSNNTLMQNINSIQLSVPGLQYSVQGAFVSPQGFYEIPLEITDSSNLSVSDYNLSVSVFQGSAFVNETIPITVQSCSLKPSGFQIDAWINSNWMTIVEVGIVLLIFLVIILLYQILRTRKPTSFKSGMKVSKAIAKYINP